MKLTLMDYCKQHDRPELLEQWHPQKNGELTPADVSFGSKKMIWWLCEKGHLWQAPPFSRTSSGSGCPYCDNKKVWPGSDLVSKNPRLAAQWHPTKNGGLTPEQVLPGTHRTVWWRCAAGHEWQARVNARDQGSGCPICSNRTTLGGANDLATTHPALAAQWHPIKNGSLTPQAVVGGSSKRVWWQCGRGHQWQARINSRVTGNGCPICAGKTVQVGVNDLGTTHPALAAQWHPTKNGSLTPQAVVSGSNKRVWWQCDRGHQWSCAVVSRTNSGSGCPYCTGRQVLPGFNDLQTLEPLIAAQWHPTLNGQLTPDKVGIGSHKKIWWQCGDGHVWQAFVYSRTSRKKCGCPVCAGRVNRPRQARYETLD